MTSDLNALKMSAQDRVKYGGAEVKKCFTAESSLRQAEHCLCPLLARGAVTTDFQAKVPLQEAGRALQQYAANMTAGKVLLTVKEARLSPRIFLAYPRWLGWLHVSHEF